MKRHTLLVALSCLFLLDARANRPDTLSYYAVSADAHGFMCPFLTPKYMERISGTYDCSVRKDDQLVIHVVCYKDDGLDESRLLQLAEIIGYERKNIHIKRER